MPTLKSGSLGVTLSGGTMVGVPAPHAGPEWSGVPGFSAQSLFEVIAGELPPGITIAQKAVGTGTTNQFGWKGTPTELGVWTATIGPSGTFPGGEFEWTIGLAGGCPLIALSPDSSDPGLPDGYPGEAYSEQLSASNGVAPYVWDLVDGDLPDGLTLSVDGLLSGTPTETGDFTVVLRATDDNGCPGVATYTLSIVARARIVIGGEEYPGPILQADFELGLNQRSTAHLVFGDGYIPDRLAEVVLYARDGVTPVFGGIILRRHVRGMDAHVEENATECDCVDFSIYFDDASVTLSYDASVAVEDVIAEIVDQVLGDYGITYTPVATGLTMDPFSWVDVVVTTAFKQISEKTGLVFRTDPTKALLVFVPGTDAAPFPITNANIASKAFDVDWSDGEQLTANTVELFCGPSGPGLMSQEWVADGVATSWVTDLPAIDPPPILVEVDDGVTPRRATVVPVGTGGGQFEWDRDTHTLSLGTDPVPASGTILRLGVTPNFDDSPFTYYTVQFPFKVRVQGSPATPPITYRENRPDCVEYAAALELANGILARESTPRRDLTVTTDLDGFLPGQALAINTTARGGINGDFLVASVRAHLQTSEIWDYTIVTQESQDAATYKTSYVDQWKALTSGGTAAAIGAPATVTAPVAQPTINVFGEVPDGDIDGVNLEYTTAFDYQPGSLRVYVGVRQLLATDFTETGANTFEMNTPLDGNDHLQVDYIRVAGTESIVGPEGPAGADGALVLLASLDASGSASLDFATRNAPGQSGNLFQSDFDEYRIEISGLVPATNNVGIGLRVTTNAGVSYVSTGSYAWTHWVYGPAGTGQTANTAQTAIRLIGFVNVSNTNTFSVNGFVRVFQPRSSALHKAFGGQITFWDTGPSLVVDLFSGAYSATTPIDGLQVLATAGNLASGSVRIYGVAKS